MNEIYDVKLLYFTYWRERYIPTDYFDTIYTNEGEFLKILNNEVEKIKGD